MKQPTCSLIGEDHLLIQCGEILLAKNYDIKAIFSPLKEANIWAEENRILCFNSFKDIETFLTQNKIDYLFSIVNSHIISEKTLNNVKKMAVNYHDGPLPRYGGANATSFAILNNEKKHGITWHVINKLIDGGDILIQSTFDIDPEETTFTLNVKCYQHGLKAFETLILSLHENKFLKEKQNLDARLYNSLDKKPIYNGLVDWNFSADYLERCIRSYTVGNYKNKFSTLKFKIGDQAYIIRNLKITHKKSTKLAGSLLEFSSEHLKIATSTYDVVVSEISDIYGEKISIDKLDQKIIYHNFLVSPSHQEGLEFQKISEELFRNENFWVKEYQNIHQTEFPFFTFPNKITLKHTLSTISNINLKKSWEKIKNFCYSSEEQFLFFISIWLIYLFKLGNDQKFSVVIEKNNTKFSEFISNDFLLNIEIDSNLNFIHFVRHVKEKIVSLEKKQGYLKDIFYRYPEINGKQQCPIVVVCDENTEISHRNALIFKISFVRKKIEWLIDENLIINSIYLKDVVKNISKHYQKLMNSILSDPESPIKNFDLLSTQERNKILNTWNPAQTKCGNKFIHQIIQNIAQKYPNKKAVISGKESISYKELIEKANHLSIYLINKGFHQKHICVYSDKNVDLIVILLAILKSGNIYIPIPVTTPQHNIDLIFKNSINPIVITTVELSSYLKKTSIQTKDILLVEKINVKDNTRNIKSTDNLMLEDLAYILYTSGTTGVPKGVPIKHKGIPNLISYTISKLRINNKSRILGFASIGFDASIWEILTALSCGSSLYIPNSNELLSGYILKETIVKNKISCVILPPSALQTISQYSFSTLKTVVTGGEYCSKELAKQWADKVRLINAYGPTEATVCVTMAIIKKPQSSPPIGKPISNTKIYILDKNKSLVPVGVPGELYISGKGLSPGYLNNYELTKKYFLTNPYETNEIMYSTRDLVRWLPNGDIEYIGRIDNQIKIRGFRIELEAIESQILHIPSIKQCVVVVQENLIFGKYILAYISGKKITTNSNKIKEVLKKRLPDYMIPSFFIVLNKLPITNNGKIDRKKLPVFDPHIRTDLSLYKAPESPLEKRLSEIWSDLFEVSPIGIEDNFFDLGGHSLIVTNLAVCLQKEFHYTLSLRDFFKNPVISNLANLIENQEVQTIHGNNGIQNLILTPEIKPVSIKNNRLKTILLTGCTGFLGVHLLNELLNKNKYSIFCHIRADSIDQGISKIKDAFSKYNLSSKKFDLIRVFCGDLSKPKLGLLDEEFEFLATEVDIICHNGAYVHHMYNYEMLYDTNVRSTIEILKLCSLKKNKKIHYISTLSAITPSHPNTKKILEEFIDYNSSITDELSGYNQTKLASEHLLAQARNRGIDVNIYRPGWIMGQYETGTIFPESNHLLLLVKGCIQMGIAPSWKNFNLNILPVDFISEFIVNVMLKNEYGNKVFNLNIDSLQISWIELINYFNSNGYSIKLVSVKKWKESLSKIDRNNAMYNLLALYKDNQMLQKIHQQKTLICNNNMQNALKQLDYNLNLIKDDLLNNSIVFLKKYGFI